MNDLTDNLLLKVGKVQSGFIKHTYTFYDRAIKPDILDGVLEPEFAYIFERLFYDRVQSLKLSCDVIEKKELGSLIEGFGNGVGYSEDALKFKKSISKADSAVIKESGYTADHFEQPQMKCKKVLIEQNKNKKPWIIDEYVKFYITCARVNLVTSNENTLLGSKTKEDRRLYYSDIFGEDRQLKIYDINGNIIDADVDSSMYQLKPSLIAFFK